MIPHASLALTFLAWPDMALAAAVAVPLLLLLYLLKLRRRPLRVSSVLFWSSSANDTQVNEPFRWVRPSWLLLLHALILALFLAALGRPVIEGAFTGSTRVAIIIDASASMTAREAPDAPTRLDRAKARARELVDELRRSGDRQVAVVALAADARVVQSFTTVRAALLDAIDGIAPTDQPADLADALTLLDALAAAPADESESADPSSDPPSAILLSDGSFRADDRALPPAAARVTFERITPPTPTPSPTPNPPTPALTPALTPPLTLAPGVPINRGIVAFAAARDAKDPRILRVFAEVLSNSPRPVPITLTLSLNGSPLARRALELPPAGPTSDPLPTPSGDAPDTPPNTASDPQPDSPNASDTPATPLATLPGRARASFELEGVAEGILLASIDGSDALPADDSAALLLPPPRLPAVILVQGGDPNQPGRSIAAGLLADALAELPTSSFSITTPDLYDPAAISPAIDLIVFDGWSPPTLPPTSTLSFGRAPPLPGIQKAGPSPDAVPTGALVWERTHPLLRFVTLDALRVRESAWLEFAEPSTPAAESDPSGPIRWQSLARGRDGPVIAFAEHQGRRHTVVAFDLPNSNWPLQPGFAIFLSNALDVAVLRAQSAVGRAFRTDQPASLRIPVGTGSIPLRGPVDLSIPRAAAPEPGRTDARADLGLIPRAGIYIAQAPDAPEPALAINLLDPTESALASPPVVTVGGVPVTGITTGRAPLELWPTLLLIAAALLVLEWIVYARQIRA